MYNGTGHFKKAFNTKGASEKVYKFHPPICVKTISGAPLFGRLLVLPTNIRLGGKGTQAKARKLSTHIHKC